MYKKVADAVLVPEFTPRSGVKVQISETDAAPTDAGGGKILGTYGQRARTNQLD